MLRSKGRRSVQLLLECGATTLSSLKAVKNKTQQQFAEGTWKRSYILQTEVRMGSRIKPQPSTQMRDSLLLILVHVANKA